jgi:predicted ATPase/DNA-binding winged helix-turn-helix (wHTH) protein
LSVGDRNVHDQVRRAVYASDGWEIDLVRRELRSHGVSVPLGSRAFEIVEVLVQAGGELVSKFDLMQRVWPGAIVEENTLQFHVSAVRKALGADRGMLKTVSGRGYRLLGAWRCEPGTGPTPIGPERECRTAQSSQSNIPVAASALIGRTSARQHLLEVLSAYRVITLTGPGGIGKSALALDVARNLLPKFGGDCWFVELASISDPGLVPSAVARVLGLTIADGYPSSEAIARTIGRNKLLIVLDNCEHVVAAVAAFTETMVRACPQTSIVATSREALRIEGEYVYRVPPLDLAPQDPQDVLEIQRSSAVQLFIAKVSAFDSDFSVGPENLPLIARICRRLDGIPLAIEFAAARASTLGLQQVHHRLSDRFGLLTAGRRTALPRHRTLRAVLDWSYELLPESERRVLRHLAIFAGGFTLEAASAVIDETRHDTIAVVDAIANLLSKSLVTVDRSAAGGRWRLLDTIRAYALERLTECGEFGQTARRHAEFFQDYFASATLGARSLPRTVRMAEYARDIGNVRAALDWSFSADGDEDIGVVLTAAYVRVWLHLSLLEECRQRVVHPLMSGPQVPSPSSVRFDAQSRKSPRLASQAVLQASGHPAPGDTR